MGGGRKRALERIKADSAAVPKRNKKLREAYLQTCVDIREQAYGYVPVGLLIGIRLHPIILSRLTIYRTVLILFPIGELLGT